MPLTLSEVLEYGHNAVARVLGYPSYLPPYGRTLERDKEPRP